MQRKESTADNKMLLSALAGEHLESDKCCIKVYSSNWGKLQIAAKAYSPA
ncbi:hypothetical protein [Clostridium sp. DJ247]|nr:hypothetical protein [Clostridium sp. DJ247]